MEMADIEQGLESEPVESAFVFHGNWRDFARIALPNLLLTIVTLGFYRFWATTRERQYLWGQTEFINERLEWTGKGKELLIGFVAAIFLIGIPFLLLQFGVGALALRGMPGWAILITFASYIAILWFIGVARFRGLSYRLSRTYWRGIRGGSHDNGLSFGWSYIWKSFCGGLAAGLMVPWSMVSLWNERWGKMRFGPHEINAYATQEGLMPRYLLMYIAPILSIVLADIIGLGGAREAGVELDDQSTVMIIMLPLILYAGIGFFGIFFYAKFLETVVGGMSLENLEFALRASDSAWLKLLLGNVLLVIGTLGLGFVFVPYRNWKFLITHLEAFGTIDLDNLTQSSTEVAKHGEGLLDAFDIGAF
jgi:uncharacterized membrane protein YjgN (DUF898 family)